MWYAVANLRQAIWGKFWWAEFWHHNGRNDLEMKHLVEVEWWKDQLNFVYSQCDYDPIYHGA